MATTATHIRKLVDRLVTLPASQSGMFDKPEDERKAVRTELGRALERGCSSDEIASTVVDQLMEGRFRPTPGEIRQAAERVTLLDKANRLPDPCSACRGTDYVIVEGRAGSGACRCSCERGKVLQARDVERKREGA